MCRFKRNSFIVIIFAFSFFESSAQGDSMTWQASHKYMDPSIINWLMLGSNYRKEWETPVKLPVFHMKALGLEIKELGGGQQTTSLQLRDRNGREWSLRSLDKDVSKALPPSMRNGLIMKITQESISAAHPYVPLTIPLMAQKMKVVAANPKIYFVPDDPAFGEFRHLFANTLCLFEEREPTPDKSDTRGTDKLLEKIFEDNDKIIDQQAVLRARILDMLVGDWDRHADQWRWAEREEGGQTYVYPIPRDRDQAFFFSNGLLTRTMQILVLKHLVSYNNDLEKIRSFNYKSWPFDRFFLNGLDKEQWTATLKEVQDVLTDDVVRTAFLKLPPEIYSIRGKELERKFIGRRNKLLKKGIKYYRKHSAHVKVYGTDKQEYFQVTGDDRSTTVTMYEYKNGKKERELYKRRFVKGDTHSINLRGLKGEDHFFVDENVDAGIKIIMEGEDGKDVYDIKSDRKVSVIDQQ